MTKEFDELKAFQRAHRDSFPSALSLRVHRAISWLGRAEKDREDPDSQFIFLWIAFNAAYAQDLGVGISASETGRFMGFVRKICELDNDGLINKLIWTEYPKAIRLLLENRFVFQPFWDFHNGGVGAADWQERLAMQKTRANSALSAGDAARVLSGVFSALYTLRNQLVHGGATWASSVNREQVKLGVQLLSQLVPLVIRIMMNNPNQLWGDACYPVVSA